MLQNLRIWFQKDASTRNLEAEGTEAHRLGYREPLNRITKAKDCRERETRLIRGLVIDHQSFRISYFCCFTPRLGSQRTSSPGERALFNFRA